VISEVGEWATTGENDVFLWKLAWRRQLFMWEEDQYGQLISLLNSIRWKRGSVDKRIWGVGDLKTYTVGSGYRVLNEFASSTSGKWFKELWSLKVVGSAQLCVWRAMLEKLPTRLSLDKRGAAVPSNLCRLSKKFEEAAQHVLISCEVVQNVWDNCDRWLGISFVRNHYIINHFQSFFLSRFSQKINVFWRGMWVAIVWEICMHRNKIEFNSGIVDDVEIFTLAQLKVWSWNKFRWQSGNYCVSDWLLCPIIYLQNTS